MHNEYVYMYAPYVYTSGVLKGTGMSESMHTDITVVGAGIAGLWAAKELVDRGYGVTVVEKSTALADGATTRNEGWLHAGTYHSVAVEDETEIGRVVDSARYGHQAIVDFAPDAIDHNITYAVTSSDEYAHRAVTRWTDAGVPFSEVNVGQLAEEGLDVQRLRAAFLVEDKSVNSRIVCEKLAAYIQAKDGSFLVGADFAPVDQHRARVTQVSEQYILHSERFLITAGAGMKSIVDQLRREPLAMRFFKAHLLVSPRLTAHNYFHLEPGEAGFMNHGAASAIGINRDGIELAQADYAASALKEELVYSAITRMVPHSEEIVG